VETAPLSQPLWPIAQREPTDIPYVQLVPGVGVLARRPSVTVTAPCAGHDGPCEPVAARATLSTRASQGRAPPSGASEVPCHAAGDQGGATVRATALSFTES
jgi:hypothetical protein